MYHANVALEFYSLFFYNRNVIMAKYDAAYLHPIEAKMYEGGEFVAQTLNKDFGITPNALTFASYFSAIGAGILIAKEEFCGAALATFLAYLFDVWDGSMARTLDMCTNFGDFLDHYSDWAGIALYVYALVRIEFQKYFKQWQLVLLAIVTIVLVAFLLVHAGCEEKLLNDDNNTAAFASANSGGRQTRLASTSLKFTQQFCVGNDPAETLSISRWSGYVGIHGLMIGLLLVLGYMKATK